MPRITDDPAQYDEGEHPSAIEAARREKLRKAAVALYEL